MEYALFIGCNIPARVPQYETSARAVLAKCGVDLVDFPLFNCCGYPMRNADRDAWLLSAARNLALAEAGELEMLVLCKCCFGGLVHAKRALLEDADAMGRVNRQLAELGLAYTGKYEIRHLFTVLRDWVGEATLKKNIVAPLSGVKIAAHTGCHALRPSRVTRFDDPLNPKLMDGLLALAGAQPLDWQEKLSCCGAPQLGVNDDLARSAMARKVKGAKDAGADFLATGCPYCQLQFDVVQADAVKGNGKKPLPSLLLPQVLALAMGADEAEAGIRLHNVPAEGLLSFRK